MPNPSQRRSDRPSRLYQEVQHHNRMLRAYLDILNAIKLLPPGPSRPSSGSRSRSAVTFENGWPRPHPAATDGSVRAALRSDPFGPPGRNNEFRQMSILA